MVTWVVKKGDVMPRRGENIRRRNDGRWEGRYRYKESDGTYKYIYGKTYYEVKESMKTLSSYFEMDNSMLTGIKRVETSECDKSTLSFGEVSERWLTYVEERKKYSTYIKYLNLYKNHIDKELRDTKICDISNDFIAEKLFDFDHKKDISVTLKYSIIATINQILKFANEYYQYPNIKLSNIYPRNRYKQIKIINHSDQASLLRYLYQDINVSKAGIILCISTGLRLGEICSLRWEDIDLEQMIIHINSTVQRIALLNQTSKTTLMTTPPKSIFSVREIPMSEEVKELLTQIKRSNQEYVLCGDKPMEPRTYQNHFKKYLRDAKVKEYNFHALRHTFATNCIDNGMDIKSLSEILGHSDVQITLNRYVHPTIETKRKYMAALSAAYRQYFDSNLQVF